MTESLCLFEALGLSSTVAGTVRDLGFTEPTPIQRSSVPVVLSGADIIGRAQTGSGKTAAFALPILDRLERRRTGVQVLVLTPTRELACQVAEAMQQFARGMSWVKFAVLYGGARYDRQLRELRESPQIVVATPGRLADHQRRGSLSLSDVRMVVLDEADEMLAMGFREDVEAILSTTQGPRQTLLFSATMPPAIRELAQRFLKEPVDVSIESTRATAPAIDQRFWIVGGMSKIEALDRVLTGTDYSAMVVFVRTKASAIEIADAIGQRGHDGVALHGDMKQAERERVVGDLRSGKRRLLIATDVAARGLDLSVVSHVVNFDLPGDQESYVHRIGRTGRAGRSGTAISFVSPRERFRLRILERASGGSISPYPMPTTATIRQVRIDRFREDIARISDTPAVSHYREIVREFVASGGLTVEDIAASVSALLHRGNPIIPPMRVVERRASERRSDEREGAEEKREVRGVVERGEERTRPSRVRSSENDQSDPSLRFVSCEIDGGRQGGLTGEAIVAALADALGVPSRLLGKVRILEDRSTVEIPEEGIERAKKRLRRLWIVDRRYKVAPIEETSPREKREYSAERRERVPARRSGAEMRVAEDNSDRIERRERRGVVREDGTRRSGAHRGERKEGADRVVSALRSRARQGDSRDDRAPRNEGRRGVSQRGAQSRDRERLSSERSPRRNGPQRDVNASRSRVPSERGPRQSGRRIGADNDAPRGRRSGSRDGRTSAGGRREKTQSRR